MTGDGQSVEVVQQVEPWCSVWAKTGRDDQHQVTHWLSLPQHLADTAAIAGMLLDSWVSPQVVGHIARDLDGDAADVRTLAMWLAAVHDVGKASPAFAVQNSTLADAMRRCGLIARPALAEDPQRSNIGHQLVGHVAVRDWLHEELGFSRRVGAAQLAVVVGSHHGVPPTDDDLLLVESRPDLAGGGAWQQARSELLEWSTSLVGGREVLGRFAAVQLGKPSQALLTGIVIMADWIASNDQFFPLDPLRTAQDPPRAPDPALTARRAELAWRSLDLPTRWAPRPIGADIDEVFGKRFHRARGAARPVQIASVEVALAMKPPGMVVIEAPMGEGKTEAALLAAEALAARSGADGCFVALPTRATSDAMFGRVRRWMEALPDLAGAASLTLAHGTASLNDEFAGLMANGRASCVGEPGSDEAAIAHFWLQGRKKGPLAQFVVGTIDQVLFAGLKSRHLMLRHLALAGKVVIVDEVHAYDVYMSEYLDRVLHWLGAYGVPVVLLSATLPAARRTALLRAYDSGRGTTSPSLDTDPGYPVVLASGLAPRRAAASGTPAPVTLQRISDELDELVAMLQERLAGGGCAVVVRNTVSRVQETADRLITEFGDEHVTVNHSRFLACDRARTDRALLYRFGPPGPATTRPDRHIVVASQVVEQSLDVDFDLMVSDLAPIDLVLQRIGRLHRHQRARPPRLQTACCVLVGVQDWTADPVQAVNGSRRVYSDHTLLQSAALLVDRDMIEIPTDIAPLVQRGYGPELLGSSSWQDAAQLAQSADIEAAARRRRNAQTFRLDEIGTPKATLLNWIDGGIGDADDDPRGTAQVRDGGETLEVLVVVADRDGGLLTPDWIERGASQQIPLNDQVPTALARVVAACALRLPPGLCQPWIVDQVIHALEDGHRYPSFESSPLLKGSLVLVLDQDRTAVLRLRDSAVHLTYNPQRGLQHELI